MESLLKENCTVLFVGINPSTANVGELESHYFVGGKNQFFKLMNECGFYTGLIENDDQFFESLNVSITNYCQRATKSEKELTQAEKLEGKHGLMQVIRTVKPKVICFVGKMCCKHFLYVPKTNNDVEYGLQTKNFENTPVYCIPSGSSKGWVLSFTDKKK